MGKYKANYTKLSTDVISGGAGNSSYLQQHLATTESNFDRVDEDLTAAKATAASATTSEAATRAAADTVLENSISALQSSLEADIADLETLVTAGTHFIEQVEVATTANITLSGEQTIDGVTTSASRVLVKNQTDASENGVYVSDASTWTRATDADTAAELYGIVVDVASGGTANGNTRWALSLASGTTITVDTTDLPFVQVIKPQDSISKVTESTAWVEGHGVPAAVSIDNDNRVREFVATDGKTYTYEDYRGKPAGKRTLDFDLIVYGATLSGLMAARKAKNAGKKVAIVDPWPRPGGAIVSGGLVVSDFPSPSTFWYHVVGETRKFFRSIISKYDDPDGTRTGIDATTQMLQIYDPRAFQDEFMEWAADIDLIVSNSPIFAASDIRKTKGNRISSIRSTAGWLNGKVFIDASYEGDLIRASGAPYNIGRESQASLGEPFAGFKPVGDGAYYLAGFTTAPDGTLVQAYSEVSSLSAGDADSRVQTLSIRQIITNDSSKTAFFAPTGYDKADYYMVGEALALAEAASAGSADTLLEAVANQGTVYLLDGVDARQTNNGSSFVVSFERAAAGTDYANGNWTKRQTVVQEQAVWQQGLLYYLANDVSTDFASLADLETDAATFGYASNLYPDSAQGQHFPDWAYIRETMRLDGAYKMNQADMYDSSSSNIPSGYSTWHSGTGRNSTKTEPIARWAYFFDAHACRIFATGASSPYTFAFEGPTPTPHASDDYDIPLSALRTGRGSGTVEGVTEGGAAATHVPNLLVSVCVSTTHVAWMSLRMEPCWSMIGEACGHAAVQMIEGNLASQDVVYATLKTALNNDGFRL